MERRKFLQRAAALTAAGAATATGTASAADAEKIVWKLPTSFPAKAPGVGTNVTSFARRVEEMSAGRLSFKIYSSGELVPPFAVEDAVQKGTVEIGHTTPYYAAGKNPALHFFSTVPFGMNATEQVAWLRHGGGQELWDEVNAERGIKSFYSGNSGTQSAGWFKKEITSVKDLSGLNMRIAGLGGEAMRKLGVNAILLPPPEIFPSFKSGAIDAAEWVGPLLDQAFGLNKVANICYVPAFHEPGAALCISVNLEAWNSLPEDLQHIVEEAALATSVETLAQFDYFNVQAFTQLKEQGVDFKVFPDDVVAALKQASKEVIDDLAKDNEQFKKVYDSYQAFLAPATEYANVFGAEVFRQRS